MRIYKKIQIAAAAGLLLTLAAHAPAAAQQKVSDVRVVVREVYQELDSLRAILEIEAIGFSVAPREQMRLFPVIRSGMNERAMPPVVIRGRTAQSVVKREDKLSRKTEPVYASYTTKGHKLFHEKIQYNAAIPIEDWMGSAYVAMAQERGNCRGEFHRLSVEILPCGITFMQPPVRPVYELPAKIPVPPREEIKNRSASGEAQIIYTVGNAEIKPSLAGNQAELDKIRRSIEDIRKVPGVRINSISISSYASPEGTWQSNLNLSERRAASLVGWIRRNYDLAGIALNSRGLGEDWDGLEQLVKKDPVMTSAERETVLSIVEGTGVFDGRERQLQHYNGGRTYRYMLANLFPQLRRSAYRIDFTVPEYSVETIREIFNTHPNMLSLYEFYLLANQYEPGSRQFREVIEKATEMYPDNKLNKISMAMFSYFAGNIPAGLEFLRGLEDDPDAWLYFSILYVKGGDLSKAEEYARRALAAGNPDAEEDLELILRYKEEDVVYREKLAKWEKYGVDK